MVLQVALLLGFLLRLPFVMSAECQTGGKIIEEGFRHCQKKLLLLSHHNKYRNMVAAGQIKGQPPAADMIELRWSEELEKMAQNWANTCKFGHDPDLKMDGQSVGQNLAVIMSSEDTLVDLEAGQMVSNWFNEVKDYNGTFSMETGHYTQVVWSSTRYLGCGAVYYSQDTFYTSFLVCNYFPAGNILGRVPYVRGKVDCKSHGLMSSKRYTHLCVKDFNDPTVCPAVKNPFVKNTQNRIHQVEEGVRSSEKSEKTI